ncbi:uncharacterized protein LOC135375612 [Ornithodoros turicata]|uniref:uncharacterized protein LOC135375612 n=1 Tax=Ornithodoros turicata TaxID=34597 RepID=UPI0031399549
MTHVKRDHRMDIDVHEGHEHGGVDDDVRANFDYSMEVGEEAQTSGAPPHSSSFSAESTSEEYRSQDPTEDNFSDSSSFLRQMRKHIAMLYMKATEVHRMPRTVMMNLFDDFRIFLELCHGFVQRRLRHLAAEDIQRDVYDQLVTLLSTDFLDMLSSPIKSNHMYTKYVKESLPYTEPQELRISGVPQRHTLYYVPIGNVLKSMLTSDDAVDNVLGTCHEPRSHDVLTDVIDGDYMSWNLSIPLDQPPVYIGILAAYFSVLNLHPKYRSRLSAIHLVMLVKYAHVKTFGIEKVLDPLIKDIMKLHESGIEVVCDGATKRLIIFLLGIVGDNLSLNRIGGFSSSFGSGLFCRFCLTDSKRINEVTSERDCNVRTAPAHEEHVAAVEADSTKSKICGVTARSPLLQIPGFDVTQQLLPDAMHDILEGGIAFVLKHVLKSLAVSEVITATSLSIVSTFKYGFHDSKSKPAPLPASFLTPTGSLRGTASQKWCLFRLLPQMIGHLVPEGNPAWAGYLQYRHIVDIILAGKVPKDSTTYLEVEIEAFLKKFMEVFPDKKLIPKMHFLVHYPRFMRMYGPPRMFWSMRFESKHSYFKNIATKSKSFVNICKTMSNRGQLLQCYEFSAPTFAKPLVAGTQKCMLSSELPQAAR